MRSRASRTGDPPGAFRRADRRNHAFRARGGGFLSNAEEAARLAAHDVQDQIATALAEAIIDFLRAPAPEAAPTQAVPPTP